MPKKRYIVSMENGYWQMRWPWQARRHFRAVKQHEPGEAVILAKALRGGRLKILAERVQPFEEGERG
jgi:hypothetical protein